MGWEFGPSSEPAFCTVSHIAMGPLCRPHSQRDPGRLRGWREHGGPHGLGILWIHHVRRLTSCGGWAMQLSSLGRGLGTTFFIRAIVLNEWTWDRLVPETGSRHAQQGLVPCTRMGYTILS